jgi:L-amino acid N-acyltransferase YncA
MSRNVVRDAQAEDCASIAAIYNEGIAEGRSTFETEARSTADIEEWFGPPAYPVLVVERDRSIAGWARIAPYSSRACYARVAEASVYVRASMRGGGLGSALAAALRECAAQAGLEKVIGKLFSENEQSRRLAARHGFREVGLHLRHGRIRGEWRDVIVVELLLGEHAESPPAQAAPSPVSVSVSSPPRDSA